MEYLNRFIGRKEENQQNLIEYENKKSHDIFKNRLLLTSIINSLIFLIFVFAMCYYDWATVSIPLYLVNPDQSNFVVSGYLSLYANLVYGKQVSHHYYQTYPKISQEVCISSDIYCISVFQQLLCIGVLTFIILAIGSLIQAFDIYKMIRHFVDGESELDYQQDKKDNLRHIITIGHFLIGITLNLFGLIFMDVDVSLGVSFYIFAGGFILFVIVIAVQQVALHNLHRQRMILALMQSQKKASSGINGISIELSSESDAYL